MKYIKPNKWLFNRIIKSTPLVSIDLVIKNNKGDYLLNLRGRYPAYNKWFFFGGSIKKPEKPKEAFIRILEREFFSMLKADFDATKLSKLAVHQYKENLARHVNEIEKGIQYYVLCYEFNAELSETEIQSIILKYREKVNNSLFNKIKELFGFKTEPEALDIKWFSKEQIQSSIEVHDYVRHYFNDDPNTIIAYSLNVPPNVAKQTLISPSPYFNSLLALYQIESKSINSYTTVIWAFPIVFIIAFGNIFKNFHQSDLILVLAVCFAFVLLQAFKKHTFIHEALKESLDKIENNIKQESEYIRNMMPDWSSVNERLKSHVLVRNFLILFSYAFAFISLLTILFHHIRIHCGFFHKIKEYIIDPLCK